jgi:dipeptidyl aminopeptidase/acylaminoacyl peptidase
MTGGSSAMSHRIWLTALLLIVTLASAGMAQNDSKLEDPPWIKEVATKRIVYGVPGMEKIRAQKDLAYKRVAGAELKMDVYNPPNLRSGARRHAIVFIHGGALPPNLRTKQKSGGPTSRMVNWLLPPASLALRLITASLVGI